MKRITRRTMLQHSSVATAAAVALGVWPGVSELLANSTSPVAGPDLKFPTAARDRLAVAATWPFRAYIDSPTNEDRDKKQPGMDLRELAAKVKKDFDVPGVEPLQLALLFHRRRLSPQFPRYHRKSWRSRRQHPRRQFLQLLRRRSRRPSKGRRQWQKMGGHHHHHMLAQRSASIAQAKNARPDVAVVAEQLQKLVEYAASKNILLNLENDNLVSEDAFFLVKVIKKVNSPYLHALPDFCNSMQSGNEQFNYDAVTALFPLGYNICHVKDSEAGDNGKVVRVDLKKTFAILKASNYRGYCSMEWEGAGNPYDGTRFLIKSSMENL